LHLADVFFHAFLVSSLPPGILARLSCQVKHHQAMLHHHHAKLHPQAKFSQHVPPLPVLARPVGQLQVLVDRVVPLLSVSQAFSVVEPCQCPKASGLVGMPSQLVHVSNDQALTNVSVVVERLPRSLSQRRGLHLVSGGAVLGFYCGCVLVMTMLLLVPTKMKVLMLS